MVETLNTIVASTCAAPTQRDDTALCKSDYDRSLFVERIMTQVRCAVRATARYAGTGRPSMQQRTGRPVRIVFGAERRSRRRTRGRGAATRVETLDRRARGESRAVAHI